MQTQTLDTSKMSNNSSAIYATATGGGATGQRLPWLQLLLLLLFVVFGCCIACGMASSSITSADDLRLGSHKLCGATLNRAMELVCVNGFKARIQQRRNRRSNSNSVEAAAPADADLDTELSSADFVRSPLLSSFYGTEVLIKTRRQRRQGGIYNECCLNSCTYPELLAYCL